jgi:peptidoglycan/LPS O-acetylase OafA/YrhL
MFKEKKENILKRERLEFIDFAKGFAILSIVLFHFCQPYVSGIWEKAIMIGGSGAHLFFLLSGFGLGLSKSTGMGAFYRKRFLKILIPYYIIIITIYAINILFPFYKDVTLYALFGHLFFYKMFDESIMVSMGYHFWFLSTIIQFYIVFPFLVWMRDRMSSFAFLGTTLSISVVYWLTITYFNLADERIYNSFFLQFLWEFSLGMVLAKLYTEENKKIWEQSNLLLMSVAIGGMLLMALMALKGGRIGQTFNDIPASIGYASLAAFVFSITSSIMKPVKRFFIFIGNISYEFYLIHMIMYLLLNSMIIDIFHVESNIFIALFIILPLTIWFASYVNKWFLSLFSILDSRKRTSGRLNTQTY